MGGHGWDTSTENTLNTRTALYEALGLTVEALVSSLIGGMRQNRQQQTSVLP